MRLVNRDFRDRDYVETEDSLFFTVVGNIHPKDRVLGYPKYLPSSRGRWGRGTKRYKRLIRYYSASNVMKEVDFLRRRYPQYVFWSEPLNIFFPAVPLERIAKHYRPEELLRVIWDTDHSDRLQKKAIELTSLLSNESEVSRAHFGITGSILLDVHNVRFSDIDLVVYGRVHSHNVKEALLSLYAKKEGKVERLGGKTLSKWCREQSSTHQLSFEETLALYARKWNKGVFENTVFSIHPVKVEDEVAQEYGEELYKSHGIVEARAKVVDSRDACFLPAIYFVNDVKSEDGIAHNRVERVVSFEELYADIAGTGDTIMVRGKLEEVSDRSGRLRYHRILVGSFEARGSDFVKVAKP